MGNSIFGIGISGLNAAQAGLITTGHNISNASTVGFKRQQTVQSTNNPQFSGGGFLGQGVAVSTVRRIYSDVLSNQVSIAQTQSSQLDAYYAQIRQLSSMLGDPSAGLSPSLQSFFSGVADVAAHPESIASRQAMLSTASVLSARFQDMNQQMNDMRQAVNGNITSSIASINSYAQQIANLNQGIALAESVGDAQPANDLRDQRDTLIASLGKEIRATVVKEASGDYNVFIGNGQPVVLGRQTFALAAVPSLEDRERLVVAYQNGPVTVRLADNSIQGGQLGGVMSYRNNTLDGAQNALGRVAITLAATFNTQHALGQDLNGVLGGNFFRTGSPNVQISGANTGSGTVGAVIQNVNTLTTSDYQLQYNGVSGPNENFVLTRLSDGVATAITFPTGGYPHSLNIDGVTLTLGAGAALNDNWVIQPTRLGAGQIGVAVTDPAAIAAASPIRTAKTAANTGNANISAGSVTSVAGLPLPGTITLTYNAGTSQFTVGGAVPPAGPFAYVTGNPISFNGLSFTVTGTPANGDTFTISTNTNGTGDNRNILALSALQAANTIGQNAAIPGSQPNASYQGAYSQLVSQIGNSTRQLEVTSKAQQQMVVQAQQAYQSLSGVNLDEEAANLLRYQQAYQASGKLMQVASEMFDTVLQLG